MFRFKSRKGSWDGGRIEAKLTFFLLASSHFFFSFSAECVRRVSSLTYVQWYDLSRILSLFASSQLSWGKKGSEFKFHTTLGLIKRVGKFSRYGVSSWGSHKEGWVEWTSTSLERGSKFILKKHQHHVTHPPTNSVRYYKEKKNKISKVDSIWIFSSISISSFFVLFCHQNWLNMLTRVRLVPVSPDLGFIRNKNESTDCQRWGNSWHSSRMCEASDKYLIKSARLVALSR